MFSGGVMRIGLLAVVLSLMVAGFLGAGPVQYQLRFNKAYQDVSVTLNGYPLVSAGSAEAVSSISTVSKWIVPGRNILTISFVSQATGEDSPSLSLGLTGRVSENAEEDINLVNYSQKGKLRYPETRSFEFRIIEAPLMRLFREGKRLSLDDSFKVNAYKLLQAYALAMKEQDVEVMLGLLDFTMRDSANSSPQEYETVKTRTRDLLQKYVLAQSVNLNLPAEGDIVWTPVLNSWAMHLSLPGSRIGEAYEFNIGEIGGKLMVVR